MAARHSKRALLTLIFMCAGWLLSFSAWAMDIVKISGAQSSKDTRMQYKLDLLEHVLMLTKPEYGDYEIRLIPTNLVTRRAAMEVGAGDVVNVFMAVTTPELEQKAFPVRIPLRRGILNYRLLVSYRGNEQRLSAVENLAQLKQFKVGVRYEWATRKLLKSHGFETVEASTLDGLYKMLGLKRFDYIPRGINEVWDELASREDEIQNLVIVPGIALKTVAPYYVFVSHQCPQLAQRLELGLERMVVDGSLNALFYHYYRDAIARADLSHRRIFELENFALPERTPLARQALWFEYDK